MNKRTIWTKQEINWLINNFEKSFNDDLINQYPNRSLNAILLKAKRLKLKRPNITKQIKSDNMSGNNNPMFGKTGPRLGIKVSNETKLKMSISAKKSFQNGRDISGTNNGMYGKIPWNKNIKMDETACKNIKNGINNYWHNLKKDKTLYDKRINQLRNDMVKKVKKMIISGTIPENLTESILIENKIKFKKQHTIGYYTCDFVINNKIIEVQGDYWHGNPKFYNLDNINETQQKNINRDKRKRTYLLNKNYKILYIWEYDLKNNINKVENKILNFI